ncbi:unnamed protein product [Urochloa humidicola]
MRILDVEVGGGLRRRTDLARRRRAGSATRRRHLVDEADLLGSIQVEVSALGSGSGPSSCSPHWRQGDAKGIFSANDLRGIHLRRAGGSVLSNFLQMTRWIRRSCVFSTTPWIRVPLVNLAFPPEQLFDLGIQ